MPARTRSGSVQPPLPQTSSSVRNPRSPASQAPQPPQSQGWTPRTTGQLAPRGDGLETRSRVGAAPTQAPPQRPVETLDLSGLTLQAGTPLVLSGLDPNRAIARIEVESLGGHPVEVQVGRERQGPLQSVGGQALGFPQPVHGEASLHGSGAVLGQVKVYYADPSKAGYSDYYSIPKGKDGIKPGGELVLPIPPHRQGMEIQNIDVSFHAPLRDWDPEKKWENKPTYATWYTGETQLQRKFVDPNADNGNAPEIDNIHPPNASSAGVLAKAERNIRIKAENSHISADEDAMTVQWVRVMYKPSDTDVHSVSFKGAPLPNQEWQGRWVQPGQTLPIDVDPSRKIARVEIQWSDKPDDVGYEQPGKWATGSLRLDGQPIGKQREHVGSPEWQFFDNLGGPKGRKLEIAAESCPLKVFEVRVHYEK